MLTAPARPAKVGPDFSRSTSHSIPDQKLIERIAAGDKDAMRILWKRHSVRVHRFVTRIVGDASLGEDVTSDTFLAVWRNAGRFEGYSSASTWILGIARHRALSALRACSVKRLAGEENSTLIDPALEPEAELRRREVATILRRCMASLSPAHAAIIDLVYFRETPINKAAEILGIPENTAKTRIFHARAWLAELLPEAGINRDAIPLMMLAA